MIDYHIHTDLCKHATGTMEEYVEFAINIGLKEICFTDHNPFANSFDIDHRMREKEFHFYIDNIIKLQKNYPEISILSGLETDYIEGEERYLDDLLNRYPIDFVLMSIHFISGWNNKQWVFNYSNLKKPIKEIYSDYYKTMKNGIKTGLFDCIAHFDLIRNGIDNILLTNKDDIETILELTKKFDLSIEINSSGIRKNKGGIFPKIDLIKKIVKKGIPVTFGSDAHHPYQVGDNLDNVLNELKSIKNLKFSLYKNRQKKIVDIEGLKKHEF